MTRADLWLPLLRRLTEAVPGWGVWKRPDSALEGMGDLDTLAPEGEWECVAGEFHAWAAELGLLPVVACTHVPELLVLAACEGEAPVRLLQMDVYASRPFRGARLTSAAALAAQMRLDDRGFRRLRPGSEGLLLLLAEGVRPGGRPADAATVGAIAALLREDPEGAERTAAGLETGGRHALAVARALIDGGWNRRALVALELSCAARLTRPRVLSTMLVRDFRRVRPCELLRALEAGRRVPGDHGLWLDRVSRSHAVHGRG